MNQIDKTNRPRRRARHTSILNIKNGPVRYLYVLSNN